MFQVLKLLQVMSSNGLCANDQQALIPALIWLLIKKRCDKVSIHLNGDMIRPLADLLFLLSNEILYR